MKAHEQLERQLAASVRGLRAAHHRRPRWLRKRVLLVVAPLAVAGGAAAATSLVTASRPSPAARQLASRAVRLTLTLPACTSPKYARASPPALVDGTPLPAITALLPGIAKPPATPVPADVVAQARQAPAQGILRTTLHAVRFPSGLGLMVFVATGNAFGPKDPAGCLRARLARLAKLQPDAESTTRRQAETVLRDERDTATGMQMLWVSGIRRAGHASQGGAGLPVLPDSPSLRSGIVMSDSNGRYAAIADPRTASVIVENALSNAGVRVRRRIVPRLGLVAFALPKGTGRMRFVQRAADGHVVAMQRFR